MQPFLMPLFQLAKYYHYQLFPFSTSRYKLKESKSPQSKMREDHVL